MPIQSELFEQCCIQGTSNVCLKLHWSDSQSEAVLDRGLGAARHMIKMSPSLLFFIHMMHAQHRGSRTEHILRMHAACIRIINRSAARNNQQFIQPYPVECWQSLMPHHSHIQLNSGHEGKKKKNIFFSFVLNWYFLSVIFCFVLFLKASALRTKSHNNYNLSVNEVRRGKKNRGKKSACDECGRTQQIGNREPIGLLYVCAAYQISALRVCYFECRFFVSFGSLYHSRHMCFMRSTFEVCVRALPEWHKRRSSNSLDNTSILGEFAQLAVASSREAISRETFKHRLKSYFMLLYDD